MMNSNSLSAGFQTQFTLPTRHSFNFRNTDFKNPLISFRKPHNQPPKAVNTNGFWKQSPEETLYDLLGISQREASLSEIKRAYKKMALKYHPDLSPSDQVHEYTQRFIRIQEAYKTLSDPVSRAVYDSNLANGLHLAFSGKKVLRFGERSGNVALRKQSWEVQIDELRRRNTVETARAGRGGRLSWAARIRKQRVGSDLDQYEYGGAVW